MVNKKMKNKNKKMGNVRVDPKTHELLEKIRDKLRLRSLDAALERMGKKFKELNLISELE
jgi:hypothetical protein